MCTSSPNAFTIRGFDCAQESHGFPQVDVAGSTSFDHWFTCPHCLDPALMNAIRRNTGFLEQVANSAAPLSFRTNDWMDIGPVDIQYGVSRGPFRIAIEGNQVVDARGYIQQAVEPQIDRLASTIDEQIRSIDLSGFLDYTRIY
jgi:hypothetical protein